MRLRSDDPATMKNFIGSIQNKVTELNAASRDSQGNTRTSLVTFLLHGWQMEFMLETISNIKNNKKKAKEDPFKHTRIKKWLQELRVESILVRGLKWSKLLDPEKKVAMSLVYSLNLTFGDDQKRNQKPNTIANSGQAALEKASIFENGDLGNNFMVSETSLGQPKAKCVCAFLQELNDAVKANIKEHPITLIETNPSFFSQFTLVVATQEHAVIESKPDHFLDDLRLISPWPELKKFTEKIDLDTSDTVVHKHIPYILILVKIAEEWAKSHGGRLPSSREEKKEFKELIKAKMVATDEDNYKEAIEASFKVFAAQGISQENPRLPYIPVFGFPLNKPILILIVNKFSRALSISASVSLFISTADLYMDMETHKDGTSADVEGEENGVTSAKEDLALERKLAKKLKVNKRKLGGVDDELDMILEGIPSALDSLETDTDMEEASRRNIPRKKHKKNSKKKLDLDAEIKSDDLIEELENEHENNDAQASVTEKHAKYVPPQLKSLSRSESEEYSHIRKRVRGWVNPMWKELQGKCPHVFWYAAVFAALVSGLACLVGVDFGAKLLASLAKCFEDEYEKEDNLSLRNLTLLLSYLYIFGVCSSDLIYDFMMMMSSRLTEVDVSTILTVLNCSGMRLRSDDPATMKNFICSIQNKVTELNAASRDSQGNTRSKRMEFMLETISDIKNNKKKAKEDPFKHTRIKKWLQEVTCLFPQPHSWRRSMAEPKTKYDRQLRIWGEQGQAALEKASISLLNCGPTGSETLKNLVLGGIGSITVVDGSKVENGDLGNNFTVRQVLDSQRQNVFVLSFRN
ncbi:hypothetical protein L1987_63709 [Smallanthus sonchifolius]|uniref:Uncharacterized protein n=1 Tax=Smallanthus sonchifolius TaxID=185202 RepID=A0ACB9CE05_9ASTR|nr:hypothetical protein L1987_63709 [Smallanthus sonchifolius]